VHPNKGTFKMKEETATTISRLARQMIIEAHEKFEHQEFIESLKLFNDVVSTLMMNDKEEDNEDNQ
jgi:hypothetical protein